MLDNGARIEPPGFKVEGIIFEMFFQRKSPWKRENEFLQMRCPLFRPNES
jgi:hypothetical protein